MKTMSFLAVRHLREDNYHRTPHAGKTTAVRLRSRPSPRTIRKIEGDIDDRALRTP